MHTNRRDVLKTGTALVGGIGLGGCVGQFGGGDYPQQDIDWIVIWGTGGGGDVHSRAIAEHLPNHLPEDINITVRNVTGAGGTVGSTEIYNSDPDAYTMGHIHGPITSAMQVLEDPDYDVRDFVPIGRSTTLPHTLCVSSDLPYQSLEELQDADETISIAVAGLGHAVLTIPPASVLGLDVEFVSGYDGSGDAIAGVLRGDVDAVQNQSLLPAMLDAIDTGDLTPIITYSDEEPEPYSVLTAEEAGYDELVDTFGWASCKVFPPNTMEEHPERVEVMREAFDATLNSDEMQEWADENDQVLRNTDPDQMRDAYDIWLDLFEEQEETLRANI